MGSCAGYCIPLVYASSAATYGMGEFGYDDNHEIVSREASESIRGIKK
jgi:ADP-L-glycero-D-manno-heptose 6-epimerase